MNRLKVMAIQTLEPKYGLPILLEVAGMARSTYYYKKSRLTKPDKYQEITDKLKELHSLHKGRYGYRRLTAALQAEGYAINHKTVRKLMRRTGIECRIRRRRKRMSATAELVAKPNILARQFHADAPFQKAVTDVTEFFVCGHKVYVSALLDLYDGAVMSMTMSNRNNTDLIMSMFDKMEQSCLDRLENMLIHSDQGILYRSTRYYEFLKTRHIVQSMSRRGNCYDNAVIESFFGTFKSETIRLYPIKSIGQLANELREYTKYYNEVRLKSSLGYRSPLEYRKCNGFEL